MKIYDKPIQLYATINGLVNQHSKGDNFFTMFMILCNNAIMTHAKDDKYEYALNYINLAIYLLRYNEENGYKFLPQMYADLIKYAFADDDIIKAYKEIEYIRIA